MNVDDVMTHLEKAGTPQTRKTYARHGVTGKMFGTSYAVIGKLTKSIKVDHSLADKLWATANHDARVVATMVADAGIATRKQLDAWAGACDNYVLTDAVAQLVAKTPNARATAEAWTKSTSEFVGQAGWTVLAVLARTDPSITDDYCMALLARIEKSIAKGKNRVRHAMNSALIAIGGRSTKLRTAAIAAAKRIGPVSVDHGDTACETPDAVSYIGKIWARKKG